MSLLIISIKLMIKMADLPKKSRNKKNSKLGKTIVALGMAAILSFLSGCGGSNPSSQTTPKHGSHTTIEKRVARKAESKNFNEFVRENFVISKLPDYNKKIDGQLVGRNLSDFCNDLEKSVSLGLDDNGDVAYIAARNSLNLGKNEFTTIWNPNSNSEELNVVDYSYVGSSSFDNFDDFVKKQRSNSGLLPPTFIYLAVMQHPDKNFNVFYAQLIEDVKKGPNSVSMRSYNYSDIDGDGKPEYVNIVDSMKIGNDLDPLDQIIVAEVGEMPFYEEYLSMSYDKLLKSIKESYIWHSSWGDLEFDLIDKNSNWILYNVNINEILKQSDEARLSNYPFEMYSAPIQFAIVNVNNKPKLIVRAGTPENMAEKYGVTGIEFGDCDTYIDAEGDGVLEYYDKNKDYGLPFITETGFDQIILPSTAKEVQEGLKEVQRTNVSKTGQNVVSQKISHKITKEDLEFFNQAIRANLGLSKLPSYKGGSPEDGMDIFCYDLENLLHSGQINSTHYITENNGLILGRNIQTVEVDSVKRSFARYSYEGYNFSNFDKFAREQRANSGKLYPTPIYFGVAQPFEKDYNYFYAQIVEDLEDGQNYVVMRTHNYSDTNYSGTPDYITNIDSMKLSKNLSPTEQVHLTAVGKMPFYEEYLSMSYEELLKNIKESCTWYSSWGNLSFELVNKNSKEVLYEIAPKSLYDYSQEYYLASFPFWRDIPIQFEIINVHNKPRLVLRTAGLQRAIDTGTDFEKCNIYIDSEGNGILEQYNSNRNYGFSIDVKTGDKQFIPNKN